MKHRWVFAWSSVVLATSLASLGVSSIFTGTTWVCLFLAGTTTVFGLVWISILASEQHETPRPE
jgi:hypothetical protein